MFAVRVALIATVVAVQISVSVADDRIVPPWNRDEFLFAEFSAMANYPFEIHPDRATWNPSGYELLLLPPYTYMPEYAGRSGILDVDQLLIMRVDSYIPFGGRLNDWYVQMVSYAEEFSPGFDWWSPRPGHPYDYYSRPMMAELTDQLPLGDGWHYRRDRLWVGSYISSLEDYGLIVNTGGHWLIDQLFVDVPEPSAIGLLVFGALVGAITWRR
ncbi:MAG: PEP-CTERM sorting domain-containing protein [Phycisphaerae bacterium]